MICVQCERPVPIENKDEQTCATCNKKNRDTRKLLPAVRTMFLTRMIELGATDPEDGTDITMGSDVHHKKGKQGYANEEKRALGIPLLIDVDFFLAVNRNTHTWIELNPDAAKAKGYSVLRIPQEQ